MSRFRNQTVEIRESSKTIYGSGLDFRSTALLIPCVQGLGGKISRMIYSTDELATLGLDEDVEVEFKTTGNGKIKKKVPNAVKSAVESFFQSKPQTGLLLVRIPPDSGGGFQIINPTGQVDHDVMINIAGNEHKVTTKGNGSTKTEEAIGGALVTALASANGVKDAVEFTTKNNSIKYTEIKEKSGSTKFNWFLNVDTSKNIKPYNANAKISDTNIDNILDFLEKNSDYFYMFSVISSFAPNPDPKKEDFLKIFKPIMKWTESRDGHIHSPKVFVFDVPQTIVLGTDWETSAKEMSDSRLYSRSCWIANPDEMYDNAATKILARHSSTPEPGQRSFVRMRALMSSEFEQTMNQMFEYEKYASYYLWYFGLVDKGQGINGGRTLIGYQLQHLMAEDSIKDALATTIMNLLYQDFPLQFIETDMARLRSSLITVLKEKQAVGVIAPDEQDDPSISIYIPKVSSIPHSEKAKGLLKNVQITVKLSGGIEKIIITFNSVLR